MGIFDKLFGKKEQKKECQSRKFPTIEEFPTLNSDDRMGIIMLLGDSGTLEYFPFLKYAIEKDPDIDVKFAALKRIHHFKDHPDTVPMMTELKKKNIGEEFEPYFSMALSQLGIISFEEFEEKMDNPQ